MKNILFVGNSYTYFNDMPTQLFAPMIRQHGDWQVTAVTCGGYHLDQFADPTDPEGVRLRQTIAERRFDVAVLQDFSLAALVDVQRMDRGLDKIVKLLRSRVENFVLFATWGRKTGCPTLDELGVTGEEMTNIIADKYAALGKKYNFAVAHVGKAFVEYARQHPQAELYFADLHHPSALGSELAARTICDVVVQLYPDATP